MIAFKPFLKSFTPYLLVAALIISGWGGYKLGSNRYYQLLIKVQQETAQEIRRQQEQNDAARQQQIQLSKEMEEENAGLEDKLRVLEEQANADSNATRPSLSHSSVQRLNSIH